MEKKKLRRLAELVDNISKQIPSFDAEVSTASKINIEAPSVYGNTKDSARTNKDGLKN